MARCEVCGREIRGPAYKRIIEGAKIVVCEQCSRFGSDEWTVRSPQAPPRPRPPRRDQVETTENVTPIEGYGKRIRQAREKMGLEPDKFANSIGEKTSTIKMLEREELIPDQAMAMKIKHSLKLDVLTREVIKESITTPPPRGGPTIGDLLKTKQKKESEPDSTE